MFQADTSFDSLPKAHNKGFKKNKVGKKFPAEEKTE